MDAALSTAEAFAAQEGAMQKLLSHWISQVRFVIVKVNVARDKTAPIDRT